jgi:hypothetical protein
MIRIAQEHGVQNFFVCVRSRVKVFTEPFHIKVGGGTQQGNLTNPILFLATFHILKNKSKITYNLLR